MKKCQGRLALRAAVLAATVSSASFPALAQTQMPVYEIRDIGTLGGNEARGLDINDLGEVTGEAAIADGTSHAFIYRDGEMIDLGNLTAGRYGPGSSRGAAINNKGEVAGTAVNDEGLHHAVLFTDGLTKDLGTLGGAFSEGHAINEAGQVTGIAFIPGSSEYYAFLYSATDGLKGLGTLGDSYSTGDHINEAGEVAGIYQLQFASHAYLYTQGSMVDLFPGTSSYVSPAGVALNSAGHVTGTYRINDSTRSFLYRQGSIVDLGTLGGATTFAAALNDSDQATGDSTSATGTAHGFLWSADGVMQDLGTLGGDFSNGTAINESGQVTGHATTAAGFYHPFVYSNGQMIDLGLPGDGVQGISTAINDLGQATGIYQVPSDDTSQPYYSRTFIATPIALLFAKLQKEASTAGPGTILRDILRVATWYYDRADATGTCATLTAFEIVTRLLSYDRTRRDEMTKLAAAAHSLMSVTRCNSSEDHSAQSSKSAAGSAVVQKVFTPSQQTQALQWYRERLGIDANGIFVKGRFGVRPQATVQAPGELSSPQ